MDSIDVKFITYPMTNKESDKTTETTIEDATKFKSETHQVCFIIILKIYI